jgi:hypothetical protein
MGPVLCVPLADSEPLQAPDALHEVAFTELHDRTAAWPDATEEGAADSIALGEGIKATVAKTGAVVPPAPVQARE